MRRERLFDACVPSGGNVCHAEWLSEHGEGSVAGFDLGGVEGLTMTQAYGACQLSCGAAARGIAFGMRILFAEDDRQLRASVTRGLREESYAVAPAGTGPQGMALVQ